jgi:predicted acetylornithine/succinylornithine family transaminase
MSLYQREQSSLLHTYKRFPMEIQRGNGVYLYDTKGDAYLDFLGGVAVNALGYGHRELLAAIEAQVRKYIHISNYFLQEPQIELAESLKRITGYAGVFFCNSGAEACEGALKLARKWGSDKKRSTIVTMQESFHGRTMGALSMMSNADYREGFGPFLDGCVSIPFNDADQLAATVNEGTTAVVLEVIQGEGGIHELSHDFAEQLQKLRAAFGFLVIADEVQSGIGRTGKFLASEHYGLNPDIVTLAKPLGGGLPLGAILVTKQLMDVLKPGNHGTTFGGNPVACAAGRVVLREIVDNGLMHNAEQLGAHFTERLNQLHAALPHLITEVRGKGLMVGVELSFPGRAVVDAMLERKIIINVTHGNILRFLPPLIVEQHHVDEVCSVLRSVLETVPRTGEVSR